MSWPETPLSRRRRFRTWASHLTAIQVLAIGCAILAIVAISTTVVAGLAVIKQGDMKTSLDVQNGRINQQDARIDRLEDRIHQLETGRPR